MAVALKYESDAKLLYTPGSAVANKAVVVLYDQCFIAPAAIAANVQGLLVRCGHFTGVAKPTDEAWVLNQELYWDVANAEFTIDPDGGANLYAGRAGAAAASAAATGDIVLNAPKPISQQAVIADPSGGATVDAEARTAINAIIDAIQVNGIVATA